MFCSAALLIAACAGFAIGQDDGEQRIKKSLLGRMVLVKMDLPAINSGVGLIVDDLDVSYNTAAHTKMIKESGVAIKNGTRSKITDVRISSKGIEIDLDGGGLPGTDWMVGNVSLKEPTPAAKSDREVDLERQSQVETVPSMINYLNSELDYERQRRLDQDARNREAFNRFDRLRSEYIVENRKNWGSKLVVVIRSTKTSITMRDMVKSLAKYVELLPSEKPAVK